MVSDLSFVEFGDRGLFSRRKIFAMVCDDQLFLKRIDCGHAFIGDVVETPPYPGPMPIFLISGQMEDRDWLSQLVRITTDELPITNSRKKCKDRERLRPTSRVWWESHSRHIFERQEVFTGFGLSVAVSRDRVME